MEALADGTKGGDRGRGAVGRAAGWTTSRRSSCTTRPPPGPWPTPASTADEVDGFMSHGTGALPPIELAEYLGLAHAHRLHRLHRRGRIVLGDVPRARRGRHRPGPDRHRRALLRVHLARRSEAPDADGQPLLRQQGPDPVRRPLRPHPDRQARHVGPAPHARVRDHHRAAGRDRRVGPLQRRVQPRRLLPRPHHHRGRPVLEDDRRPASPSCTAASAPTAAGPSSSPTRSGPGTAPTPRSGCSARARPSRTRP